MKGNQEIQTRHESTHEHYQVKTSDALELNMDATLLFRYKLAEVQKKMQNEGIIADA